MLFPYTYVPHKMEMMQEFIDFIFFEVWCKAPIGLEFHPDLFNGMPELREVMSDFGFSAAAPERGKKFYKDVKAIYQLFALLSVQDIEQFKQWYRGNNDIEKVCANDPAAHIVRYADIPVVHNELSEQLKSFFTGLYSPLLKLEALRNKIGSLDEHYSAFVGVNRAGKCPFCGINDLLGEHHHPKREAYDHYLPKALYPFNSINFRNLVPACHHCNSSYKTSKDPAHPVKDPAGSAQRRKFFYPFRANAKTIEIAVSLAKADIDALSPQDIDLQFGPVELTEEIATWRDVYGIDERYKAKMLGENDGKYWYTQVLDEWREEGKEPADYLKTLTWKANKYPFADSNFLKLAFLEGCQRRSLFETTRDDS